MTATWRDAVLAESDDTIMVEGNHYCCARPSAATSGTSC
jgi:hypothetical protein